jgi:hypothetical protein
MDDKTTARSASRWGVKYKAPGTRYHKNLDTQNVLKREIYLNGKSLTTSKKRLLVSIIKIRWLVMFVELVIVYYENHGKYLNSLCGKIQSCWVQNEVVNIVTSVL